MEDDLSGFNLINGAGTVADYVQNSGGAGSPYVTNQTPYDVLDNGLLASTAGTVTNGVGMPVGTSGASISTLPNWLSGVLSLGGTVASTAAQVAPLINGRPATSTAFPGAQPVVGVVAPPVISSMMAYLPMLFIAAVVGVFAWMFLKRDK